MGSNCSTFTQVLYFEELLQIHTTFTWFTNTDLFMYVFIYSFILLYVAAVLFDRDTAQPRRCTRLDLHVQETETSLFRIDKYQVLWEKQLQERT